MKGSRLSAAKCTVLLVFVTVSAPAAPVSFDIAFTGVDGSLIPDALPGDCTALLAGFTFDANGDEVAAAFADAVPVPAAAWPFASGMPGMTGAVKGKKAQACCKHSSMVVGGVLISAF